MDAETLTGRLVVATASLMDPNFHLTATLILEHAAHGALGVALNRPSETLVDEIFPEWCPLVAEPRVLFRGGPVQPNTVIAVARTDGDDGEEGGWQPIDGTLGVLDLSADPATLRRGVVAIRVFAGYSGWGPGQLEAEIVGGGWFVVDALPDDPFSRDPDELWHRVLRRQGGLFTTIAADPTMN
jgi:putative transcriptional regulator